MSRVGVLVVVIVVGYVLFELSMLQRLGYRMEADYILGQMVSSAEAVALCGSASREQGDTFTTKFDRLLQRALREQREEAPDADPQQLAAGAEVRLAAVRAEVKQLVGVEGCDGATVSTLLQRFTLYAGRR